MPLIDSLIDINKAVMGQQEDQGEEFYAKLPLLNSLVPVLLIDIAYAAFVLKIGPDWMRRRQAFNLRTVLLVYNALQVVVSFYMAFVNLWAVIVEQPYDFSCIISLPPGHKIRFLEVSQIYLYYLVKYVDYLDTIFFVLRKNFKQITFLHVYHHMMMTLTLYVYLNGYGFGGHIISVGILNCLVHGFMYAYYFLSALRPEMKKSLWWKKYITKMQIAQFVLIVAHQSYPLFFHNNCTYPKVWAAMGLVQGVIMLVLFSNFYINTYVRKKPITSGTPNVKDETKMH